MACRIVTFLDSRDSQDSWCLSLPFFLSADLEFGFHRSPSYLPPRYNATHPFAVSSSNVDAPCKSGVDVCPGLLLECEPMRKCHFWQWVRVIVCIGMTANQGAQACCAVAAQGIPVVNA